MVIPKIIIGQRNGKSWLTWIGDIPKPEVIEYPKPEAPLNLSWEGGALEPHAWEGIVAKAVARITTGELEKVVPLVRQAIELGADVVKADPTDIAADYHHVIQTAASVPVLVRGGGRVSDEELLNRTAEVLKQGAAGIVYGRNIIAHPKPAKMTQALMAMLHKGTSAQDALKIVSA